MTKWRRAPRQLSGVVDGLRDQLAPQTLLAEVQQAWPGAVGPAIAAEARPTAERAGVVTVACSASVWAHELDLMAPTIVERVNDALGSQRVSRLRCVATPPNSGKSR